MTTSWLIPVDALRGSLKSESSTATTPSTGRSPKQLPGIENQRIFQNEYEVEEVPDSEMEAIPR